MPDQVAGSEVDATAGILAAPDIVGSGAVASGTGAPEAGENAVDLGFTINVDAFSGPLDLLLFLVRKSELDIVEIPIASITDQFVALVGGWQAAGELDLEGAGDFILMAATLLEIKARAVAPPPPEDEDPTADAEDDDQLDPRADLIAKLIAYRRFKEATGLLLRCEQERATHVLRLTREDIPDDPDEAAGVDLGELQVSELSKYWYTLLARIGGGGPRTVAKDDLPIELSIRALSERAEVDKTLSLEQLFALQPSLQGRVSMLMATLECTRQRIIESTQFEQYGPVRMRFREPDERAIVQVQFPPEEPQKRRRKRPPLVTYTAPVSAAPTESGVVDGVDAEAVDTPEEPYETDEERFLRELNETCAVDAVLARVVDVEQGFQRYWRDLHPELFPAPVEPVPVEPAPPEPTVAAAAPAPDVVSPAEPVAIAEPAAVADAIAIAELVAVAEIVPVVEAAAVEVIAEPAPVIDTTPIAEAMPVAEVTPVTEVMSDAESAPAALLHESPASNQTISPALPEPEVAAIPAHEPPPATHPDDTLPDPARTDVDAVVEATSWQPAELPQAVPWPAPAHHRDDAPPELPAQETDPEPAAWQPTEPAVVLPLAAPATQADDAPPELPAPEADLEPAAWIAPDAPPAATAQDEATVAAIIDEPVAERSPTHPTVPALKAIAAEPVPLEAVHQEPGPQEPVPQEPVPQEPVPQEPGPAAAPMAMVNDDAVDDLPVPSARDPESSSESLTGDDRTSAPMPMAAEHADDDVADVSAHDEPLTDEQSATELPAADLPVASSSASQPMSSEDAPAVALHAAPVVVIPAAVAPEVPAVLVPAPAPVVVVAIRPAPQPLVSAASAASTPIRPSRTLWLVLAALAGAALAAWWVLRSWSQRPPAEPAPTTTSASLTPVEPAPIADASASASTDPSIPAEPALATIAASQPQVQPSSTPRVTDVRRAPSPALRRMAQGDAATWWGAPAWPIAVPWYAHLPVAHRPESVGWSTDPRFARLPAAALFREGGWAFCLSAGWQPQRLTALPVVPVESYAPMVTPPASVAAWMVLADLSHMPVTVFLREAGWAVLAGGAEAPRSPRMGLSSITDP